MERWRGELTSSKRVVGGKILMIAYLSLSVLDFYSAEWFGGIRCMLSWARQQNNCLRNFLPWNLRNVATLDPRPNNHNYIAQNPSNKISKPRKVFLPPDFEALKLRNVWSSLFC